MARTFPIKAEPVTMRQLKNMWVLATRVMFQLRVVQKYLMTCHCRSNNCRCLASTDRILSSKLKEFSFLTSSPAISRKARKQNKHIWVSNFNNQKKNCSVSLVIISVQLCQQIELVECHKVFLTSSLFSGTRRGIVLLLMYTFLFLTHCNYVLISHGIYV